MSEPTKSKTQGHRSELQWIVNDPSAYTFQELFDQPGGQMAQGLPGNEIESFNFQGTTLTVKLVSRS